MCDDKSVFPLARTLGPRCFPNLRTRRAGHFRSNLQENFIFGNHFRFLYMFHWSWSDPAKNQSWYFRPVRSFEGAPMTKAPTCMSKPDPPKCQGLCFYALLLALSTQKGAWQWRLSRCFTLGYTNIDVENQSFVGDCPEKPWVFTSILVDLRIIFYINKLFLFGAQTCWDTSIRQEAEWG